MNKLEWNRVGEGSPCNKQMVIVLLKDGSYSIAWQQFGEWPDQLEGDKEVVAWADYTSEWLSKTIANAISNGEV